MGVIFSPQCTFKQIQENVQSIKHIHNIIMVLIFKSLCIGKYK